MGISHSARVRASALGKSRPVALRWSDPVCGVLCLAAGLLIVGAEGGVDAFTNLGWAAVDEWTSLL